MWEPVFLASSQGQTWFLAIVFPYLKVMVAMPNSHVQRIHQGFYHVHVWQDMYKLEKSEQSLFTDDK